MKKCEIPPHSWYCTRVKGHDGPCAALPINTQSNPSHDTPSDRSDEMTTQNDKILGWVDHQLYHEEEEK